MTKLLQKAFDVAAALSDEEQDAIGAAILDEIESERRWRESFDATRDKIDALAEKALKQHRAGKSGRLDPETLSSETME